MVRILHLSDLAFPADERWRADPVFLRLPTALGSERPDLVAITGDVARTGDPAEFTQAEAWIRDELLPGLGLPVERLFLVAGERDAASDAESSAARGTRDTMLREGQFAIAEVLDDPDQRRVLLKRLDNWLAFANRLRGDRPPLDLPWWHEVLTVHGQSVGLGGLCSAWTARGEADRGLLLVGEYQANAVLEAPDMRRADVRVALLHHPLDWLHWQDTAAKEAIQNRARVLLFGHPPHRPFAEHRFAPNDLVEVAVARDGTDPRCAVIEISTVEVGAAEVRLRPWIFRRARDTWVPDRNLVEDGGETIVFGAPAPTGPPAPPSLRLRPSAPRPEPYPVLGACRALTPFARLAHMIPGTSAHCSLGSPSSLFT